MYVQYSTKLTQICFVTLQLMFQLKKTDWQSAGFSLVKWAGLINEGCRLVWLERDWKLVREEVRVSREKKHTEPEERQSWGCVLIQTQFGDSFSLLSCQRKNSELILEQREGVYGFELELEAIYLEIYNSEHLLCTLPVCVHGKLTCYYILHQLGHSWIQ